MRPVRAGLPHQPASPVSGVLFPGGGESPTFPQVRLGCPSLWSAISGISALAGRVSGSGLWWRFSNFRFGGAETGSTADRDWLAECLRVSGATPVRSPQPRRALVPPTSWNCLLGKASPVGSFATHGTLVIFAWGLKPGLRPWPNRALALTPRHGDSRQSGFNAQPPEARESPRHQ